MVWTAALALILAQAPYVTTVPNDTDLHAAFCAGYWKNAEPPDPSQFPEQYRATVTRSVQEVARARQRIAAYLIPRMEYLEPAPLLAAMAQGQRTYSEVAADMPACLRDATTENCQREWKAVKDCRETPFLPF